MIRLARLIAQTLPLLGVLALLPLLLAADFDSRTGAWPLPWRLDAQTIVMSLVIALGIAALPLRWHDAWRSLLAIAILFPALLADHMLILPVALLLTGVILRSSRFLLAAITLLIASVLLIVQGGARWSDPLAASLLDSPIFVLILFATAAGLGAYPFSMIAERVDPARLALQPIWIVPLLRTIEWGPWNSGWAVATVLIGGGSAVWAAASAVWDNDDSRIDALARVWLGMALACAGLLTPVGIAAALWLLLAAALALGLFMSPSVWAAPLPPSAMFVATWLVIGATAASGAMLLAAVLFLATWLSALAVVREQKTESKEHGATGPIAPGTENKEQANNESIQNPRSKIQDLKSNGLVLASIAAGILSPILIRSLILPAVDQLQGGLTPFGLINIWPWVGLAALDAGQRRVAALPSVAVSVLALVVAAIVWLSSRWPARHADTPDESSSGIDWARLREHVWWARGLRRRG